MYGLEVKYSITFWITCICSYAYMFMTELQMGARHKPVIFLQFITNLPLVMLWVSFMSGFQHLDF